MSLGEIKNVFQREDVSTIEEVLAKKNELLHEQMRELKSRHSAVERAIASIERYRKSPVTGTTSLEYIDRRYTWGIPCRSNFYGGDIGEYEKVLIELRKELIAHSFQHMIGIAAERPVDLPAAEGQEQPDDTQGLDGPADGGDAGPDASAYGAEAGMAARSVSGLEVQVKSGHKGAAPHEGVKNGPGNQGKVPGDGGR